MDRAPSSRYATSSPSSGTVWIDVPAQKQHAWRLVLEAEGIAHRAVRHADGISLVLASRDAERGMRALAAYEQENPAPTVESATAAAYGGTIGGAAMAAFLLLAHVVLRLQPDPQGAAAEGAAVAGLILGGQVWRTVTALTLHADLAHVLANVVGAIIFGTFVSQALGVGVGAWLTLLSGAIGNYLDAMLRPAWHTAVGASTAVFGTVGLLVGLQLARHRHQRAPWLHSWSPLLAGLVLLGLLGVSERADVAAHVLGFVAGTALGTVVGRLTHDPAGLRWQWAFALATMLTLVGSWTLALHH